MLKSLRIEGYALIDSLEIDWEQGLTALTGETGSGKSIVLGALGLALGERGDSSVIRSGSDRCMVEAIFQSEVHDWLKDNDFELDELVTLRREISAKGRSRAFINDTPCSVQQLRELGTHLVDLHGQDDTRALADRAHRIALIDDLGKLGQLVQEYSERYHVWKTLTDELHALKHDAESPSGDIAYLTFQIEEIQSLQLDQRDFESLQEEMHALENASNIQMELRNASNLLSTDEAESDVLGALGQASKCLTRIAGYMERFRGLHERIEATRQELLDVLREIDREADHFQEDPQRLSALTDWFDECNRLMAKHRLKDTSELTAKMIEMVAAVDAIENRGHRISALDAEIEEALKSVKAAGVALRNARVEASNQLISQVKSHFGQLKMSDAELAITWEEMRLPDELGLDDVEWEFRSHPSSTFQPITQVASGGERSRVMLAIKALQAEAAASHTIILDEIDTGVSGHVAECMARLMLRMSTNQQVIAVTHLAQVAGQAAHHYKVSKLASEATVLTTIQRLNSNERIEELAGMLSGETITEAAKKNAEALLRIA